MKVNGLKLNKFFVFPILLVLSLMTTIILLMFPGDREYTKLNFVYYYLYTFDEVKKIDLYQMNISLSIDPSMEIQMSPMMLFFLI